MQQKVGLFITRAQPGLHLGQMDGLQQAIKKGVTHFLIGIGSSNKEFTMENPFTYDERKHMIELSLKGIKGITFAIFSLPDFPTDEEWKSYILTKLPFFGTVITGNPWVREVFSQEKKVVFLQVRKNIKGTFIRSQLALGRYEDLTKSLTKEVVLYLKKIKADQRMKEVFHNAYESPKLAVDVIFCDKLGNLVLVDRKHPPYGLALPGGFVNYGEEPKNAAIREVQEETGIQIQITKLLGVYGDPARDPRMHTVSVVYAGVYMTGQFKAGDDAKKVVRVKIQNGKMLLGAGKKICFDHEKIISQCLKNACK